MEKLLHPLVICILLGCNDDTRRELQDEPVNNEENFKCIVKGSASDPYVSNLLTAEHKRRINGSHSICEDLSNYKCHINQFSPDLKSESFKNLELCNSISCLKYNLTTFNSGFDTFNEVSCWQLEGDVYFQGDELINVLKMTQDACQEKINRSERTKIHVPNYCDYQSLE
jgi:hypothetical protein